MKHAPLALALAALVSFSLTGPTLAAADPCAEARTIVGEDADGMSPAECEQVVDAADEERWQLWLDLALAHEQSGDYASALDYYGRFVTASSKRERPLTPAWQQVQQDSVASMARMDARLLETHARVDVTTEPAGGLVAFDGTADATTGRAAPFSHYLTPGAHSVDVLHPTTGAHTTRQLEVAAGQIVALDVAMNEAAPARPTLPEGPTSLGAPTEPARPAGPAKPLGVVYEAPPSDTSAGQIVGVAVLGLGLGAVALGAAWYLNGDGYIDEGDGAIDPVAGARRREEGEDLQTRGTITMIVGAAAVVGGVVTLALTSGDDEPRTGATLDGVSPVLMPDGSPGVGAAVSF